MLFKDRVDAGEKLVPVIKKYFDQKENTVVVSLLRGGVVVGNIIANKLGLNHLPLAVAKIPFPHQPELALGALCFDEIYLEKPLIKSLELEEIVVDGQIEKAEEKFNSYCQRFNLTEDSYNKVKDQTVFLVDDGVATGSTAKVAFLFLKSKKAKEIILAVPGGPTDFDENFFDKTIILEKRSSFFSVSQLYEDFQQVEDEEVKRII